ncbi:MAG: lipid II flippase MurJ, partial [Angelakisella sp.]
VTAVFVVSVATAIFPELSKLNALKNTKKLKSTFVTSSGIMSLIVLPISAGIMVFSKEIITLLFLRGAFTAADVERTAQVLFFYSFGLLAFSIKDVMLNVFYAIEDTKTP